MIELERRERAKERVREIGIDFLSLVRASLYRSLFTAPAAWSTSADEALCELVKTLHQEIRQAWGRCMIELHNKITEDFDHIQADILKPTGPLLAKIRHVSNRQQ